MRASQLVSDITIRARTDGVEKTTQATEQLGKANDGVTVSNDKLTRSTRSIEAAYERMRRQVDSTYRQTQQFEAAQRTLDRAFSVGRVSASEYDRTLGLLATKYSSVTAAVNDNVRSSGQLSAAANASAGRITAFTGALSGAALGAAVLATGLTAAGGAIATAGDTFVGYRNKLIAAGEDQGVLNKRLAELTDIAIRSRTGLEPVVELYSGMSKSTADLGKTQTQVARVVETVSKAFATSGSSAAAASGAILQLNQAFASGVLRGDELNSVLEGAPPLARLIAKEFGVAVGELKSLGEEGKLSADRVFTAFLNGSKEVDTTFNSTATTIGQASTNAGTALTQLGAELDNLLGIAARVVGGLNAVAGAIRGIAGSVASFGDATKLQGIQASLQSIQQFETNIAGLRGKNDFASRQDLIAETAKLAAERAAYNKLVGERIDQMVGKPAEILLNAEGMITTARATRTATKALEDLKKVELDVARDGMGAVEKATLDANKAFQDREKIAKQMRDDGVENAKIADFEARSQKILAEQIKQANDAAAKKGGSGSKASSGTSNDGFDNARQRIEDQTRELRLQQEQASKTGVELYKLEAAQRLRRAALQAGRGDEKGMAEAIEETANAYALQRKATEDAIEGNRKLKESFNAIGDSFKSLAEDLITGSDGISGALKSLGKTTLSNSLDALISGKGPLSNLTGLGAATKDGQGGLLGLLAGLPKAVQTGAQKGSQAGTVDGVVTGLGSFGGGSGGILSGLGIDGAQLAGGLTAIAGIAGAYGIGASAGSVGMAVGGGALSGALGGAALGTAIMPGIGTAIGAIAGAIAGGGAGVIGGKSKTRKEIIHERAQRLRLA